MSSRRNGRSILDFIEENIVDGRLPDGFALPEYYVEHRKSRWHKLPGQDDDWCLCKTEHGLSLHGQYETAKAIKAACSGEERAYGMFRYLGERYKAIVLHEYITAYIAEHRGIINIDELFRFATEDLIFFETDIECVKFGMIILASFGDLSEDLKNAIWNLGLYEEFTFFALLNIQTWDNSNEIIFDLAKRVKGYGKIHAVEMLKPETREIKDWFLFESLGRDRYPDISALICMQKADILERLKATPSSNEVSAIGRVLTALYEYDVIDVEDEPNGHEILDKYLNAVVKVNPDVDAYRAVLDILLSSYHNKNREALADQILHSEKCEAAVREGLKSGKGVLLAKHLEIPYQEQLLELMRKDFARYFHWSDLLMKPEEGYVDSVLEIYQVEIPPESIEQNPWDIEKFGEEYEKSLPLQYLLQNLGYYPGKGMDYVMRTIQAPAVRCRAHAVRAIAGWVTNRQLPLETCYPKLYEHLKEAYAAEKSDEIKKLMRKLLDGTDEFFEDEVIEDEYSHEAYEVYNYW